MTSGTWKIREYEADGGGDPYVVSETSTIYSFKESVSRDKDSDSHHHRTKKNEKKKHDDRIHSKVVKTKSPAASWKRGLQTFFLPEGYPHSVSPDYLQFQVSVSTCLSFTVCCLDRWIL